MTRLVRTSPHLGLVRLGPVLLSVALTLSIHNKQKGHTYVRSREYVSFEAADWSSLKHWSSRRGWVHTVLHRDTKSWKWGVDLDVVWERQPPTNRCSTDILFTHAVYTCISVSLTVSWFETFTNKTKNTLKVLYRRRINSSHSVSPCTPPSPWVCHINPPPHLSRFEVFLSQVTCITLIILLVGFSNSEWLALVLSLHNKQGIHQEVDVRVLFRVLFHCPFTISYQVITLDLILLLLISRVGIWHHSWMCYYLSVCPSKGHVVICTSCHSNNVTDIHLIQ